MNKDAKSVSPDVVKEDAVDEDFFKWVAPCVFPKYAQTLT